MNVQPPILLEDPDPLVSTTAGVLGLDITPRVPKYKYGPFTSYQMLATWRLVSQINVSTSDPAYTTLMSCSDGPNVERDRVSSGLQSWQDPPQLIYSHCTYKKEYQFHLIAPDEVKGRLATHVYNYPRSDDTAFDTSAFRNETHFWDFSESKRFSIILDPFCNMCYKKRYHRLSERIYTTWYDSSGTAQQDVRDETTPRDVEREFFSEFRVDLNHRLQAPPAMPDTYTIVVWSRFVDFQGYHLKTHIESSSGRSSFITTVS